jgi:hypothetical protein
MQLYLMHFSFVSIATVLGSGFALGVFYYWLALGLLRSHEGEVRADKLRSLTNSSAHGIPWSFGFIYCSLMAVVNWFRYHDNYAAYWHLYVLELLLCGAGLAGTLVARSYRRN